MLEDLLSLEFFKQKIATICGMSRWTVYRRIQQLNLEHLSEFSNLSDVELDQIIGDYTSWTIVDNGISSFSWYACAKNKSS